jgi:hypothetical protein
MREFGRPNDEKEIVCIWCHWKGQIKDTKEREVNSPRSDWMALAGREGWEYDCPKCGMTVEHFYTRMS